MEVDYYDSIKFKSKPKKFSIKIAGTNICIYSESSILLKDAINRYKKFSCKSEKSTARVDVHISSAINFPNPDGTEDFYNKQIFYDNFCIIYSNFFTGYVNIEKNYAKLITSDNDPLSWLEHFLRITYAILALGNNEILFHGAGLVHDSKGYVFFGPSGVGKSTVTELSPHCSVLGDDLIVLKKNSHGFKIYASPFNSDNGKQNISNSNAKLKGLFRLRQDNATYIENMSPSKAMAELLSSISSINKNINGSFQAMELCNQIISKNCCFDLHFTRDDSFWRCVNGN